ncbi:uncharacterized protein [Palaemon carinicauda]|uniref:uncharacterized protein n=1 Tax=Palaemon carinicauda TaxID=392227 RepID=UPI0035B59508
MSQRRNGPYTNKLHLFNRNCPQVGLATKTVVLSLSVLPLGESCKGTATTSVDYSDTSDVSLGQNHSHAPDMPKEKVTIALSALTNEASGPTAPPRRIIANITQNIDCETSSGMPKRKALTKCIQRKRQKTEGYFPEPESLSEINLPEEFETKTIGSAKERFLLYDESDSHEILIFASETMLDILATASHWMCDGKFKMVPQLFYQLYTIHAIKSEYLFACVYILLTNKTKETYKKAFSILKEKRPDLQPKTITTDFEKPVMDTFKYVFPNLELQGCFFHLSQAI